MVSDAYVVAASPERYYVLILVLMEYGLWHAEDEIKETEDDES